MNKYYSNPKCTVNEVEGTKIEKYRKRRMKIVNELSVWRAVCPTISDSESLKPKSQKALISNINCLI